MRRSLVVLAVTSLVFSLLALPASAQPNSPSGNQPTESDTPPQGGVSNDVPSNVGGGDEAGNRTTPGGGGATGGGTSTGDNGGNPGGAGLIAFLVVLAVGCVAAFVMITRRNQRAEAELEGSRPA